MALSKPIPLKEQDHSSPKCRFSAQNEPKNAGNYTLASLIQFWSSLPPFLKARKRQET